MNSSLLTNKKLLGLWMVGSSNGKTAPYLEYCGTKTSRCEDLLKKIRTNQFNGPILYAVFLVEMGELKNEKSPQCLHFY